MEEWLSMSGACEDSSLAPRACRRPPRNTACSGHILNEMIVSQEQYFISVFLVTELQRCKKRSSNDEFPLMVFSNTDR